MKQKFCMMLVAISAMALMMVSSGFASQDNSGSTQDLMNGQTQMVCTVFQGGTPPTEIVAGQTSLQSLSIINTQGLTATVIEQIQIQLAINVDTNSPAIAEGIKGPGFGEPAEIVAGQTTLLQASIPATINSAGTNTSMIINNTQDASPINQLGSSANIAIVKTAEIDIAGPGGDNFHVGKHFVASTPIKETSKVMTTSTAA